MREVWKDVVGYEGLYQVSNFGNVMSLNYRNYGYPKQLTPKCNSKGRLWVLLYGHGLKKHFLVHRLVATAFVPNPDNLPEINHKDENPKNNHEDNLEWCTRAYNVKYFFDRHHSCHRSGKQKSFAIVQETTDGEFVRLWDNSKQIKDVLGWSDWSISECCRGNRKTAYGFIWRYAS